MVVLGRTQPRLPALYSPADWESIISLLPVTYTLYLTLSLKQLAELTWIDGLYNLILSGPPGVGKTHLAIGLGYQTCEDGYKVSYTTMKSLIKVLRTEEIDRRSRTKLRRINASKLLIIDEVGYLPKQRVTYSFSSFQSYRKRLQSSSRQIKGLRSGRSYRLENRKSFLDMEEDHE